MEFIKFPSIPRLSRDVVVTEKLDGTNAGITITSSGEFLTASRSRWITPDDDNFGFSKWAHDNKEELLSLGEGSHWGEWWGVGINRGYGLSERRFSLFNTKRWNTLNIPKCCHVVPVIYSGPFEEDNVLVSINNSMDYLRDTGSVAAPGFKNPEGIVIYHKHSNTYFKKTFKDDSTGKSEVS